MSASAPGSVIERRNSPIERFARRSSRISSTIARYSVSRALCPDRRRRLVGALLDLDVEAPVGCGLGRAEQSAGLAGEGDDDPATGEAADLVDLGDRADVRVVALVPRHEQHLRLAAQIERQVHRHVREDDGVFQRYEEILVHEASPS